MVIRMMENQNLMARAMDVLKTAKLVQSHSMPLLGPTLWKLRLRDLIVAAEKFYGGLRLTKSVAAYSGGSELL